MLNDETAILDQTDARSLEDGDSKLLIKKGKFNESILIEGGLNSSVSSQNLIHLYARICRTLILKIMLLLKKFI